MPIARRISNLLERSTRTTAKQLLPSAYERRYALLHSLAQQPWGAAVLDSGKLGLGRPHQLIGLDDYVNRPGASDTVLERSQPSVSYAAPLFAREPGDLSQS